MIFISTDSSGVLFFLQERVLNCVELIKELSAVSSVLPHSPDGVLDAAYLSYNNKTEDITVRSCASSSHNTSSPSSVIKRRKQQDTSEPSSPQLEDYKSWVFTSPPSQFSHNVLSIWLNGSFGVFLSCLPVSSRHSPPSLPPSTQKKKKKRLWINKSKWK